MSLNTLGLVDGQTYPLDVFFAERHQGLSSLRFKSNFPIEQAKHYNYNVVAVDPDNDPITYNLITGPTGMSIDPTSGVLVWSPTAPQVGRVHRDRAGR